MNFNSNSKLKIPKQVWDKIFNDCVVNHIYEVKLGSYGGKGCYIKSEENAYKKGLFFAFAGFCKNCKDDSELEKISNGFQKIFDNQSPFKTKYAEFQAFTKKCRPNFYEKVVIRKITLE